MCALAVATSCAAAAADPATAIVRHRAAPVVTLTAEIVDSHLVVRAEMAPGWHIYAMDNVERAQAKSGKERPDCELPTRIAVEGPVRVAGKWRQTQPVDLSNPEIIWYTWGFENEAVFAAPLEITGSGPITVTVNGQACNESSCSMIQDVSIVVDPAGESTGTLDYDSLAPLVVNG